MFEKICGLRIDVDTKTGLNYGVPEILKILSRYKVHASFFFSTGPDDFMLSFSRLFIEKNFAKKIIKDSGSYLNLLKNNESKSLKNTVARVLSEGHEAGLHGFSHYRWIAAFRPGKERFFFQNLIKGIEEFSSAAGFVPSFTGAPGWKISPDFLKLQDSIGFDYASDVRSASPFYPITGQNEKLKTIQIPVTLPTLDELLVSGDSFDYVLKEGGVYCAHAELEGIKYGYFIEKLISDNKREGNLFVPLSSLKKKSLPACRKVFLSYIRGRTNPVAVA
ncbi:polysaccharide deacetylase family protein [candidate division WOR-3 bacterium]|nr:polysaccharide deacetylase family protein [candidate division WOR-3 bacterium]